MPEAARGANWIRAPLGMCAVFCCVFGLFAIARSLLWTYGADTGIFMQASASILHGFLDGPEAGTHFRYHWSPILAVLSPIVWLFHTNLTIQFAQILVIAATAFPLHALVRRYAGEKPAFYAALWALIYAPLFSIAGEEFHELAFYPVLALALIETADRRAWLQFGCVAFAAMLVREDVLMINVATGAMLIAISSGVMKPLVGASMRGSRGVVIAACVLIGGSLAALNGYFQVLIPAIGVWSPTHFYTYPFADGPGKLLLALVKDPTLIVHFLTLGRATYVLEAFVPLLFLPFFSRWFLVAMPGMLVVLLSNSGVVWRMGDQYAALWIPWVLLAAFDTLSRLYVTRSEIFIQRVQRAVTTVMVIVIFLFNPVHPLHYLHPSPDHALAEQAMALVPRDAYVLTHDEWYSQFALDYPNATVFPNKRFDWAVVDDAYPSADVQGVWRPLIRHDQQNGELEQVARFKTVGVYRRVRTEKR